MSSKALLCAITAASLGFASLSFAQGHDDPRRPGNQPQHAEQRGAMGQNSHDSALHRGVVQRSQQGNRPGANSGPNGFGHVNEAHNDRQYGARGPQFHQGGRLPSEYRNRQYVVNNWREHCLNAPPRGQQWVQVGSDYVLIAIATGVIAQLVLSR